MEESLRQLWILCIWFFGLSSTVTIFIGGWLIRIQAKITLGEDIKNKMDTAIISLKEIENALKGDYDKKGLITKHYELEKRVEELENIK